MPPGEPVTGPAIARAFERLVPPGREVDVGLAGIFDALRALQRGDRVDLNGATGRLDLDLTTGESSFEYAILCVREAEAVESGLVYLARPKTFEGELRCPFK